MSDTIPEIPMIEFHWKSPQPFIC